MKKALLLFLFLAPCLAFSQWESSGNYKFLRPSGGYIYNVVISEDSKFIYTVDDRGYIVKINSESGITEWSRLITGDSSLKQAEHWVFVSSDAKSYVTLQFDDLVDLDIHDIYLHLKIFNLEDNTFLDEFRFLVISSTFTIEKITRRARYLNYSSSKQALIASFNYYSFINGPRYESTTSGYSVFCSKKTGKWQIDKSFGGNLEFLSCDKDLNYFLIRRTGNANWKDVGTGTYNSSKSDITFSYDYENKSAFNLSYYSQYITKSNSSETGTIIPFQNPYFSKADDKFFIFVNNILHHFDYKTNKVTRSDTLKQFEPKSSLCISSAIDNNYYYIANGAKISIFDKTLKYEMLSDSLLSNSSCSSIINSNDNRFVIFCDPLFIFKADSSVFRQLRANFFSEKVLIKQNDSVKLYDLSLGYPESYLWDFGDGQTSTEKEPVHVYNDTDTFDVKLIVSKGSNKDTLIKLNYIRVFPYFKAAFSYEVINGIPLKVKFTNTSSGNIDSIRWNFYNEYKSLEDNPSIDFKISGTYPVTLTVYSGDLMDSVTKNIRIDVSIPSIDTLIFRNQILAEDYPGAKAIKGYKDSSGGIVFHIIADSTRYHGLINNKQIIWQKVNNISIDYLLKKRNDCFTYIDGNSISDIDVNGNILTKDTSKYSNYLNVEQNSEYLSFSRQAGFFINSQVYNFNNNQFIEYTYPIDDMLVTVNSENKVANIYQMISICDSKRFDYVSRSRCSFRYNGSNYNYISIMVNAKKITGEDILSDFIRLNDSILVLSFQNKIKFITNYGVGLDDPYFKKLTPPFLVSKDFVLEKINIKKTLRLNDSVFAVAGDYINQPACLLMNINGDVLKKYVIENHNGSFEYVSETPEKNLLLSGYIYKEYDKKYPYFVELTDSLLSYNTGKIAPPDTNKPKPEDTSYVSNVLCYPNPSIGNIKIQFTLKEKARVGLRIVDYNGKLMQSFEPVEYPKGPNAITSDFDYNATGLFYYDLNINGTHKFGKLEYFR